MNIKSALKKIVGIRTIREYIYNNPKKLKLIVFLYNKLFGFNRIRLHGNNLVIGSTILNRTTINILGKNNTIEIGDLGYMINAKITILGNNNHVKIANHVKINYVRINIEDDYNEILIGDKTSFHGTTDIAAIESTKVVIGEDCMFSGNIQIRTGDSHSVLDENGVRINCSKDVSIGSHVWVGANVICLKGTIVPDNCIIGAGSLINKVYTTSNSIIAGNPAKVIKTSVNWRRERI